MSAMILPEANANEAIKGIYSEIEEVFRKVSIAYQALALRVTSSRVFLSCSVRY